MDVIAKTKEVGLPPDEYVLVAGGAMAARGLKETADIDLVVSPKTYQGLKARGWQELRHGSSTYLMHGVYEVFMDWDSPDEAPNLEELLRISEIVDGVAVVSLQRVLQWKKRINRPKDQADIKKIEKYLADKKRNER
ncbi:hypothetical protein HY441_01805 [Candidatus Microgenomates bacterium]|nr:hypothetical protein [Candidatus Microgenomates bacterium]